MPVTRGPHRWFWWALLLLATLSLFVNSVRSQRITLKQLTDATLVFRRKPGTPDTAVCSNKGNIKCKLPPKYCTGYHIGKHYFVTRAHCVANAKGVVVKPNELDILGVGKTKVKIFINKNYSEPMGADIAWIVYDDPTFGKYSMNVDKNGTTFGNCDSYALEVFNPNKKAGFRWISQNYKGLNQSEPFKRLGVVMLSNASSENVEHVYICKQDEGTKYLLHYIHYGVTGTNAFLTDCHRVECQNTSNNNMVQPKAAPTPAVKTTKAKATRTTTKRRTTTKTTTRPMWDRIRYPPKVTTPRKTPSYVRVPVGSSNVPRLSIPNAPPVFGQNPPKTYVSYKQGNPYIIRYLTQSTRNEVSYIPVSNMPLNLQTPVIVQQVPVKSINSSGRKPATTKRPVRQTTTSTTKRPTRQTTKVPYNRVAVTPRDPSLDYAAAFMNYWKPKEQQSSCCRCQIVQEETC